MISLVYHPDERLTTVADAVETIDAELLQLASQMIDIMHEARGIGLAGPQVGHLQRLFVVHVPDDEPRVFINPRIVAASPDEGDYEEGCLSIPGVYAEVRRPMEITVEAWDERGTAFRRDFDGMLARVIQHEYDHIEGVLFLDYLTERKKERLLKHYRKPVSS
ncbi:MAG: peptide deformylase [Spirochaetales bacterium]|nr:peptide deformylase [Spirochaetales bacterium]